MILFDQPIWQSVKSYAGLYIYAGRFDLEFRKMPPELKSEALASSSRCVSCGARISPIRERKSGKSRITGTKYATRLFYSSTCPSDINARCSRSKESTNHYDRYIRPLAIMFPESPTKEENLLSVIEIRKLIEFSASAGGPAASANLDKFLRWTVFKNASKRSGKGDILGSDDGT